MQFVIGAHIRHWSPYLSHGRDSSNHISVKKLWDVAAPSLADAGYVALSSILTPEESAHFRECSDCIDALANMVRELNPEKKKTAARKSG